jgi:diguanylate cyclase (GGDEF)-like protein
MSKIVAITLDSTALVDLLDSCGFEDMIFQKNVQNLQALNPAEDIVIIEGTQENKRSLQFLKRKYPELPKIIIAHSKSRMKKSTFTEVLIDPTCREVEESMKKLLHEKNMLEENDRLKNEIVSLKTLIEIHDEIGHLLNETNELHEILTPVMKRLKVILDIEGWIVMLIDPENKLLYCSTVSAKNKKIFKDMRLPVGEGIAGWVAEKGRPVIVNDVKRDKRFLSEAFVHEVFDTASLMCTPVQGRDSLLGVVEMINKKGGRDFTEVDLSFMTKISEHLALAINQVSLHQKMVELAITDDLTKLFNTRYLERTLDMEVSRCDRYNTSLSLIFMDVDYFKNVNDRYGHIIGSKLLVEVGQLLLTKLRAVDIVARYGGDEFVIVLPQTNLKYATQIAERMRKTIAETTFLKEQGYNIKVTASFGLAAYPEKAQSKEELLKLADEAMYRVKYHTRNGVYAIN